MFNKYLFLNLACLVSNLIFAQDIQLPISQIKKELENFQIYKEENLNILNNNSKLALSYAAKNHDKKILKLLFSSGADIQELGDANYYDFAKNIFYEFAKEKFVKLINKANEKNDYAKLTQLLLCSINFNSVDILNFEQIITCLLLWLIKNNDSQNFIKLIEKYKPEENIVDDNGNTLLHLAVLYNNKLLVINLLKKFSDLSYKKNKDGMKPVDLANHKLAVYFETECSICLNEIKFLDEKIILQCNHKFHRFCFLECQKKNNLCPNCWQVTVIKNDDD